MYSGFSRWDLLSSISWWLVRPGPTVGLALPLGRKQAPDETGEFSFFLIFFFWRQSDELAARLLCDLPCVGADSCVDVLDQQQLDKKAVSQSVGRLVEPASAGVRQTSPVGAVILPGFYHPRNDRRMGFAIASITDNVAAARAQGAAVSGSVGPTDVRRVKLCVKQRRRWRGT